jgi:hypothetical protein
MHRVRAVPILSEARYTIGVFARCAPVRVTCGGRFQRIGSMMGIGQLDAGPNQHVIVQILPAQGLFYEKLGRPRSNEMDVLGRHVHENTLTGEKGHLVHLTGGKEGLKLKAGGR